LSSLTKRLVGNLSEIEIYPWIYVKPGGASGHRICWERFTFISRDRLAQHLCGVKQYGVERLLPRKESAERS